MWELVIQSSSSDRREIKVKPGKITLGRRADNDIVVMDEAASRFHAEIEYDLVHKSLTICDLESANGTYVNGKKISDVQSLTDRDQIRIGQYLITVVSKSAGHPEKQKYNHLNQTNNFNELLIRSVDRFTVLLHDLSNELSKTKDLVSAENYIAKFLTRALGVEHCGVDASDRFDTLTELIGSSEFVDYMLATKQPVIISRDSGEIISNAVSQISISDDIVSLILSPVLIDHDVAGLTYAIKYDKATKSFSEFDLLLLVGTSHYTALAFQRLIYERFLKHSANHDMVTGLPNRRLLMEHLSRAIARTKRQKEYTFALFFIDIDNFKLINDSLGHPTGDKTLKAIAERLQDNFRAVDTVARFGGDEFTIIYDEMKNVDDALSVVNRLIETMGEPFVIDGKELIISLSVGIAFSSQGYDYAEDIIRDADIALYKSKENDEERVRVYDQDMHAQLLNTLKLQTKLRDAYKLKQFLLQYQPIIDLGTDAVVGLEALIRWASVENGLQAPSKFFTSIDSTGLLGSIEMWVLQEACVQTSRFNKKLGKISPLHVSINLTNKQLRSPDILERINKNLSKNEIEPDQLWIEISETTGIGNEEKVIPILENIRSLGVQLCLDDFGTGYSTLNYLYRLPISILKIDRSIIADVNKNLQSNRIIQTIISLAHSMNLKIIAEGVETHVQMDFLKSSGCNYAQGYYFSEPLYPEEIIEFLQKRSIK